MARDGSMSAVGGMSDAALLACALAIAACGGDDIPGLTDAGTDTSVPDGGTDGALPPLPTAAALTRVVPAGPRSPAEPSLLPCPEGHIESTDGAVTFCRPFTAGLTCPPEQAPIVGAGCQAIGSPCPADGYPRGVADGPTVRFVRAGAAAGGLGTRASPMSTIGTALSGAPPGTLIAIATGTYVESLAVPPGVEVRGACAAQVLVEGVTSPAIALDGASVAARDLTIESPGTAVVVAGGDTVATLERVQILAATGVAVEVSRGASLTARHLLVRDTGDATPPAVLPAAMLVRDASLSGGPIVLDANAGHGIAVDGATARVEITDLTVTATVAGRSAAHVANSAALSIEGAYLGGGPGSGVDASSSHALLNRVFIEGAGGPAVVAEGSTVAAEGLIIDGAVGTGVRLSATNATLADTVIVHIDGAAGGGRGIDVGTASSLRLTSCVIADVRDAAIRASGTGTMVTLTDVRISDVGPDALRDARGYGLALLGGATAELDAVHIERATEAGIFVTDSGTTLGARDLGVHETAPGPSGALGRAVEMRPGTVAQLTRADLSASGDVGIFSFSAALSLNDVTVRDGVGNTSGRFGRGIDVQSGTLEAQRLLVRDNRDVGIAAGDGAIVTLTEATLSGTRGRALDGLFGRDLALYGGARATLDGVSFYDAREMSIFATDEGTAVDGQRVSIEGAVGRDADGVLGRGISLQGGATSTLSELFVSEARELGVFVFGAGSRFAGDDVSISSTRELACEGDAGCLDLVAGIGIGVYGGGTLSLTHFLLEENALTGLQLAYGVGVEGPAPDGGTADLARGRVRGNVIGANVQTADFDITRITDQVYYQDNELNLDTEALAVPAVVGDL